MKTREVITGLLVVLILVAGILLIKKAKTNKTPLNPNPTPSIEERITGKFGGIQIPTNVDKADLKDVAGKEEIGIATRNYDKGIFSVTVLGDLQDPPAGYFYDAWLVKSDSVNSEPIYVEVGKLRLGKGGYLTDFETVKDYTSYSGVVVTLEKVSDGSPHQHVLEGTF